MRIVTKLEAQQSRGHINPCTVLDTGDVILSAEEWKIILRFAIAVSRSTQKVGTYIREDARCVEAMAGKGEEKEWKVWG